jgi:hypothetical protein
VRSGIREHKKESNMKNKNNPRVGVISANFDGLNPDVINDLYLNYIDLSFEEYALEVENNDSLTEDEKERELEFYENDNATYLIGDWVKDPQGKYIPDEAGEFAGTIHEGIICVEYSKTTRKVGYTSLCFLMADGSGPCGHLEQDGEVLAYDLPKDFYNP